MAASFVPLVRDEPTTHPLNVRCIGAFLVSHDKTIIYRCTTTIVNTNIIITCCNICCTTVIAAFLARATCMVIYAH